MKKIFEITKNFKQNPETLVISPCEFYVHETFNASELRRNNGGFGDLATVQRIRALGVKRIVGYTQR